MCVFLHNDILHVRMCTNFPYNFLRTKCILILYSPRYVGNHMVQETYTWSFSSSSMVSSSSFFSSSEKTAEKFPSLWLLNDIFRWHWESNFRVPGVIKDCIKYASQNHVYQCTFSINVSRVCAKFHPYFRL